MRSPDYKLVKDLQQEDIAAFDALYHKYHLAVYRNILKITKDTGAAEDILQEVFTRLWEKRQKINPEQSVAGWLFVISFNLSVNYTKRRLREQVVHKKILFNPVPEEHLTGSLVLHKEQYQLLEKAIEQLSPQKRKIINLCKLQGKTYEEAAAELQISRHTVKEHLSAAMVSLNKYVQKHANHAYMTAILFLIGSTNL